LKETFYNHLNNKDKNRTYVRFISFIKKNYLNYIQKFWIPVFTRMTVILSRHSCGSRNPVCIYNTLNFFAKEPIIPFFKYLIVPNGDFKP